MRTGGTLANIHGTGTWRRYPHLTDGPAPNAGAHQGRAESDGQTEHATELEFLLGARISISQAVYSELTDARHCRRIACSSRMQVHMSVLHAGP